MKKGIKKAISTIAILTMTFQMGMPVIPGLQTTVLATDTTNSIEEVQENIQPTADKAGTTELSESADITPTEEISRNYEIKDEETWDVSANGDGSVIAKWTVNDRTLTISGTGKMKEWSNVEDNWIQYTNVIKRVVIENAKISMKGNGLYGYNSLETINVSSENKDYMSENGILFNKDKTKIICYPAGKKDIKDYTIPSTVTNIEEYAFYECSNLESIVIPEGVTSIEKHTFTECSNLTNITIPEGVTSIGYMAFYNCTSLANITIPKNVTSIGNYAFYGCSNLTNIIIPEGTIDIGERAFSGCYSLTNITIPESVTSIGHHAFAECSRLTNITIPGGITSIETGVFLDCTRLKNITIPEGVTNIESSSFEECKSLQSINVSNDNKNYMSENGILFNKSKTEIIKYPLGKKDIQEYIIPEGIISIGENAFNGCSNLKSIVIPESVTSIGEDAFNECSNLKSITIPESITSIGEDAFRGCNILIMDVRADSIEHERAEDNGIKYILRGEATTITTNYRVEEEKTWDVSKNGDGSVIAKWTINDRILTISGTGEMKNWSWSDEGDWHATQYISLIEKVVIENEVTNIGENAFYNCDSLESINISKTVISIGTYAFYGCSSLKSIDIPEGVTSIENDTFRECSNLKNIEIPKSVTYIGQHVFNGCTNLENIIISDGVKYIDYCAFYQCENLKNINIPEGVTSIGDYAFFGCNSLESINVSAENKNYMSENGILFDKRKTEIIKYPAQKKDLKEYIIPEGVTSIKGAVFEDCSSLTSIVIPEGVTSIGSNAFSGCSGLENITIPEGVTSIEGAVFEDCSSLTSIVIPERVTSIGNDAFSKCVKLENINIPEGVIEIGNDAFYRCKKLKSITIPEGVTSIEDGTFYRCSNLESINIPAGITSIGDDAFRECENLEDIILLESVTNIGRGVFGLCDKLIIYTKANTEAHRCAEEGWQTYIIDDKGPIITFTPNGSSRSQKGYNVKVSAKDNVEIVGLDEKSLKYMWTQNKEQPSRESFTESLKNGQTITKNTGDGDWYLWVYAKDNFDNETITSQIFRLDNTIPNFDVKYNTKLPARFVKVTITANEEIQTVKGWELSSDKKTLTKEYSANTKETVTIKDIAGNETQVNVEVNNIDKIAPSVGVTYSTKEITEENVKVTITTNEEIQNIEGWELSSDKKTLTKEYSANTKETITVKDIAGNETQVNIEINNIKKKITIGDINQDGKIDVTDFLMLKRHLVAGNRSDWKLTGDNLSSADMNENGTVDITDMLMLKRVIVENI